jgi:hypothetical protein
MKHFTKWTLLVTLVFAPAMVGAAQQNAVTTSQSSTGSTQQPQSQPEGRVQEKQTGGERKAPAERSKTEDKELQKQAGVRCSRLRKN